MKSRGFEATAIDRAVAGLVSDGLLSNTRFAESFVYSRIQRGNGPQKIRMELRERGIDDELAWQCLDEYAAEWETLIRQVRERKFGAALPDDFRERSRQMRFLQQRGFTAEQIAGAFRGID